MSSQSTPAKTTEREDGSGNTLQDSGRIGEDLGKRFSVRNDGITQLTDSISCLGDISTHGFLKRISGRLSLMGKVPPRNVTREREGVGDLAESSILILPGKVNASEYMDCFFDHLNLTYRYLPQAKMKGILDSLCEGDP
jgi:hypothetical protein